MKWNEKTLKDIVIYVEAGESHMCVLSGQEPVTV